MDLVSLQNDQAARPPSKPQARSPKPQSPQFKIPSSDRKCRLESWKSLIAVCFPLQLLGFWTSQP